MRGRKPKPVELKLLEGTYRKDRAPAVQVASRAGTPHAPEWFDEEETRAWKKLARAYRDGDRSILATEYGIHVSYVVLEVQICRTMRAIRDLEKAMAQRCAQLGLPEIEAESRAPDAWTQRLDRLHRKLRQLIQEHRSIAAELGLTPSSRSRAGWGAKVEKPADDPWAALAAQTVGGR